MPAAPDDAAGRGATTCNHGDVADRRPKTLRDMALSLGLLAVVSLVLYGMYGQVSFSPGGATEGQAPTADVTGGLERAAPLVGFPVVVPGPLPDGWNANSFSFTEEPGSPAQPPTVRAGWLTPQGRFITVVQSDGATAEVLVAELGEAQRPTGTEQIGAEVWTVTSGRRDEVAWVRTEDAVTYLITGSASPEDFRKVATAVAAGTTVTG